MPTFTYMQSSWSRGELDPRLWARTDFKGYEKAARELKNVVVLPQGGIKRRFGTKFVYQLTTATAASECRVVMFELQDTTKYTLVFEDVLVTILENDAVLTTVVSPYTAAQLPDVKFAQTFNELISVHPDVEPHRLFLETAPSTFKYLPIAFKNEPTYDFLNNYDHVQFKVSGTAPATDVSLIIDSATEYPAIIDIRDMINNTPVGPAPGDRYIHNGANGSIGGDTVEKGDIVEWDGANWQRNPNGSQTNSAPANNTIVLNNDDSNYYIFNTAAQLWTVYGTAKFEFNDQYVGGIFIGNEGTMRLTGFKSSTEMIGTVIDTFANTNTFPGTEAVLTEPIFNKKVGSSRTGYPRSVGFFQNRLWFGGTKDLPSGVWGSKPGSANFFDFDDSAGEPDNAISVFVATGNTNIVKDILGARNLFVFTTTGVSTTNNIDSSGVTPQNISLSNQTDNGIGNVTPAYFDSQVLFIDQGGKIAHSMVWSVEVQGHTDTDVSILSQHLIKSPVEMAPFRNPQSDNGIYLIVVNNDGTLAVFESLQSEDVKAWSQADTVGVSTNAFRHIDSSQDDVYFIVERDINSSTEFYVEKLDFGLEMDSVISAALGAPGKTITGLSTLEAETVQLLGDGFYYGEFVVSGGSITANANQANFTNYEVGLKVIPSIKPLPINVPSQSGNIFYKPKTYRSVWVDFYESLGITINDFEIPPLKADVTQFDVAPLPISGFYQATPMNGWDVFQELTISQSTPFPMLIRALAFEVQID